MFDSHQLLPIQKKLRQVLLTISYEEHYSHIGSCLSSIDCIEAIYDIKRPRDQFVLSNGHAGVALYTVLHKRRMMSEQELRSLNIHPDRNNTLGVTLSSGSLGQGLPIALGMALAQPKQRVFCLISDGECAEGSIWESLHIAVEQHVSNLICVLNANGYAAYRKTDRTSLKKQLHATGCALLSVDGHNLKEIKSTLKEACLEAEETERPAIVFAKTTSEQFSFLRGLDAHYMTMTADDFAQCQKELR